MSVYEITHCMWHQKIISFPPNLTLSLKRLQLYFLVFVNRNIFLSFRVSFHAILEFLSYRIQSLWNIGRSCYLGRKEFCKFHKKKKSFIYEYVFFLFRIFFLFTELFRMILLQVTSY